MDKSWINKSRSSKEYFDGVQNFIKFAIEKANMNGKILCPCRKCVNCSALAPKTVEEHLVWNGFLKGYTEWVFHGESMLSSPCNQPSYIEHTSSCGVSNMQKNISGEDDIRGLLRDTLGYGIENLGDSIGGQAVAEMIDEPFEESIHSSNDATTRYHNLVKDCVQELYPGCKNFSKISIVLHLFYLKYLNG